MTDSEMRELQKRIDTAKNLKQELKTICDVKNIILQNKNGDLQHSCGDHIRIVGKAILDWTESDEEIFNTIMEFVENHRTTIKEKLDAI